MDLLELFKNNSKFKRQPIRQPNYQVENARSISSLVASQTRSSRLVSDEISRDYYKKYVEEENTKALEAAKNTSELKNGSCAASGRFDEMSVGTTPTQVTEAEASETEKFYQGYNFEYRPQENLPILQSKEDIVSTIETHTTTIIEGVTGCGKSTQVPQFILDNCYREKKYCNIVVTQPRRIAALSIATRVCHERNWHLGTIVGCQVGMFRKLSKDTRLTYCTTGVLLRKLINAKNMLEFTHVIIDEVHERDQEMDFLLLLIRKLSRSNSRQTKIVLMSATFNVDKFSRYFEVPTELGFVKAPIISIPKKRKFKVHPHYLCQLGIIGALPEITLSEPKVSKPMMEFCKKLLNIFDEIDAKSEYDADELAEYDGEKPRHAVLVFLPGIYEIEEMHRVLNPRKDDGRENSKEENNDKSSNNNKAEKKRVANGGRGINKAERDEKDDESSKWDVVILHSTITSEEQGRIFQQPPEGKRRVILSTNIAESSITINDIKYVIDFCLTKQLTTDPGTNFQCLEIDWASKANCEQRAGRAGRVMDGRVYRLIPKVFYEKLADESDPEILRAPLENLVLKTKKLDMGEPKAVLALAIDPPDLTNLQRTILLLKESGGLIDKINTYALLDGELTSLGRIMEALPIDIHLSKLIALGHVFNVLREAIIMAASMSCKSMFNNPFSGKMKAYNVKVHYADSSASDCLAFLNLYTVWSSQIRNHKLRRKSPAEANWAARNHVQIKIIHQVDFLVDELTQRLEQLGIKETEGPRKLTMDAIDKALILKFIIAGAFYPNYFVKNNQPAEAVDKTNGARILGGLDPTRTVYLHGWKPEHPGKLYAKRIQEVFQDYVPNHEQALVEFDGSHRVYVMFSDDKVYGHEEQKFIGVPGKITQSVYKALKLRKLNDEIEIPVLALKQAKMLAEELKIPVNTSNVIYSADKYELMKHYLPKTVPLLPALDLTIIPIRITYFEHPGKFWVHRTEADVLRQLDHIDAFLNDCRNPTSSLVPYSSKSPPNNGTLVAAAHNNRGRLLRAVVESYYRVKRDLFANLYFIDTGARSSSRVEDLRRIEEHHEVYQMRALAFECTLKGLEPSKKRNPKGEWSDEARTMIERYVTMAKSVFGTVYSVVDSVVSLELTCTNINNTAQSYNINKLLVDSGLAEEVEESYSSRYNNDLREKVNDYTQQHRDYLEFSQYSRNYLVNHYPEPPEPNSCSSTMKLRGPFSPLEINLSSLAVMASSRRVSVETASVNAVLLEVDPDKPSNRLLVASLVSQNPSGSHLTVRNTTWMPNIDGLTALVCLIFSPRIELRMNAGKSYYVGALCGLGYHPRSGESLLPEHDMEIYFDTSISQEDMLLINKIRHWMDMGICVKSEETDDDLDDQALICQEKVHELLMEIISRPRKRQDPEKIGNFHKWLRYDDSMFMVPSVNKLDSIFPLHKALTVADRDERVEELTIHIEELRSLAVSDPRRPENIITYCQMCEDEMYTREELRIHLFTKKHRELEFNHGIRIR